MRFGDGQGGLARCGHGVANSWAWLSDWTELNWRCREIDHISQMKIFLDLPDQLIWELSVSTTLSLQIMAIYNWFCWDRLLQAVNLEVQSSCRWWSYESQSWLCFPWFFMEPNNQPWMTWVCFSFWMNTLKMHKVKINIYTWNVTFTPYTKIYLYWVDQTVSSRFSITSYGKTQMKFWANPVFIADFALLSNTSLWTLCFPSPTFHSLSHFCSERMTEFSHLCSQE